MRVKRGTIRAEKRKRFLNRTKGFRWGRKNRIRLAKTAILKAGVHAYRDRKKKKRDFRRQWNIKINAGARLNGTTYGRLIHSLKLADIQINRKMLAELAEKHPAIFTAVVEKTKKA